MYQIRVMRAGRGFSCCVVVVFEKEMLGVRRVGREPGRVASSIVGLGGGRGGIVFGGSVLLLRAVGSLGWLIAFWPVMMVPFAKPAEMWWEKLLMMEGRTAVLDSSTPPIMARR